MVLRYHVLGTLSATLILYVWGMAVHLGFHTAIDAIPLLDEARETKLVEALKHPPVALEDGVHMGASGLFLVVNTTGNKTDTFSGLSFGSTLCAQLLINMVVALLLTVIIVKLPGTTIRSQAGFLTLIGLAAGLFVILPQWNWYGFGPKLTAVNLLDIVGGWLLSGLALAWLARRWAVTSTTQ